MRDKMDEVADRILKQSDFTEQQVRDTIENRYGWAVAEQFDDILKGEDYGEQNSNALRSILKVLKQVSGDEWKWLAETLEDYLRDIGKEPEDFSAYQ